MSEVNTLCKKCGLRFFQSDEHEPCPTCKRHHGGLIPLELVLAHPSEYPSAWNWLTPEERHANPEPGLELIPEHPYDTPTQAAFRLLHATMLSTFLTKNAAYGDSFKKRGYMGVLVRLEDKIARIDSLVAKKISSMGDESLIDTHMDAAVYNLLAVLCLQEEVGKKP